MKGCMICKNHSKWMMLLCFSPIILFLFLTLFFQKFVYLSVLGFLICPISMGFMMYFMNKEHKCGHNEKSKAK